MNCRSLSMRDTLLRDRAIAPPSEFTQFAVTHSDLLAEPCIWGYAWRFEKK